MMSDKNEINIAKLIYVTKASFELQMDCEIIYC